MKRAFIYGEFINKSTTGIAYVNSNLKSALIDLKYNVSIIDEPRSNDYSYYKGIVKKNYYIFEFIKIIFNILLAKKYNIAYLTISMSYLGLLKSLFISFIIRLKTKKLLLYVHRGDIDSHYKESFFKKTLIKIHLLIASKIILLSRNFIKQDSFRNFQNKILIIPNSLSKYDTNYSNKIYQEKLKEHNLDRRKKIIKLIYSSNIQSAKGIHKIIEAVKIINEEKQFFTVKLDIFGMKFEEIDLTHEFINYKGKLNSKDRLKVMSNYDFLILSSKTEGLPITLIECMAIGLPFITTKVGAISDLLIENYPYITTSETLNIVNVINLASKDFLGGGNKLKQIIDSNKNIFNRRFQYSIFLKNIKMSLLNNIF